METDKPYEKESGDVCLPASYPPSASKTKTKTPGNNMSQSPARASCPAVDQNLKRLQPRVRPAAHVQQKQQQPRQQQQQQQQQQQHLQKKQEIQRWNNKQAAATARRVSKPPQLYSPPQPLSGSTVVVASESTNPSTVSKSKAFVRDVYAMVEEMNRSDPSMMKWTEGGKAFVIDRNHSDLEDVLFRYFQRKFIHSFMCAFIHVCIHPSIRPSNSSTRIINCVVQYNTVLYCTP